MAYCDELLRQAFELLRKDPSATNQADLRRAVSNAYYAVFHLFSEEIASHWDVDSSRHELARMLEHGAMKRASSVARDSKRSPFSNADPDVAMALRTIARSFIQLREKRHIADYDNGKFWALSESLIEVEKAQLVLSLWQSIRTETIAQNYLVSLLIKSRE